MSVPIRDDDGKLDKLMKYAAGVALCLILTFLAAVALRGLLRFAAVAGLVFTILKLARKVVGLIPPEDWRSK